MKFEPCRIQPIDFSRFVAVLFLSFGLFSPDLAAQNSTRKSPKKVEQATNKNQSSALKIKTLDAKLPVKLSYLISVPENYDQQEKWPLLLFLHGAGERGDDIEMVKRHGPPKLVEAGRDLPFIVVAPQCPENRWWEPMSLSALLDDVESNYQVDKSRIYVTGLSMGGFGTWSLAAHSPERFAAIAPICGGGDSFSTAYRIKNQIPIWVFHGAKDSVVPLKRSEEIVNAFKRLKVDDVKFTIYPNAGHDSWTTTYNNDKLYDWMLQQKRAIKSDVNSTKAKVDKQKNK